MNCKKCNSAIERNMKFALMKNFCPACGSPLFSEQEQNDISTLQNRISIQNFSDKLSEVEVYDVALFVFNEIRNGLGQIYVQNQVRALAKAKSVTSKEVESEESNKSVNEPNEVDESVDFEEQLRQEIRQEVEEEIASEVQEITKGTSEDVDPDDKVSRLKALHKKHQRGNLTGTMVRRRDG